LTVEMEKIEGVVEDLIGLAGRELRLKRSEVR
jgi:hypothetical protein